ncbi:leucine-rich repeat protein [Gordonibacter massiliensis (ex Traore et al. 2017)]|uniref:Leucine-rich repeat protein n=1 Tax=Gordonibacter massiliensis (ex Traore et al. 2017) TaxID=1841863 RepID=A0A842JFQ8_9ACTN|nr:leucine-rich repeat protein [Gordonibacter massiliensis (ex Traore et al. 2017)]MBC2890274.1 leucine-rich repeat protein [Gordonibacter massiliensis (ex Traore et al. 2017)]
MEKRAGAKAAGRMGRILAAAALAAALVPATALAQEEPEASTPPPSQNDLSLPDAQAGTDQVAPASNDVPTAVATVDLTNYATFEAAADDQTTEPRSRYASLTVTGKTTGGEWTQADGAYLKGNFTGVTDLDLDGFAGTFGAKAFYSCGSLAKVRLPGGAAISEWMFYYCGNLKTLACETVPEDGTVDLTGANPSFGKSAFYLSGVEKALLPKGAGIPENMFVNCYNLKTLACGTVPEDGVIDLTGADLSFGDDAFNGSGVERVRLPEGAEVSRTMFQSCHGLKTLACGTAEEAPFVEGVVDLTGARSFEYGAFYSSGVERVRLPEGAEVSESMFSNCDKLRALACGTAGLEDGTADLTGANPSFGRSAFACDQNSPNAVERVRLPEGAEVSARMFEYCKNLKTLACGMAEEVPFEEGVVDLTGAGSFGGFAFRFTIPKKVRLPADKAVPGGMFVSCLSLRTLAFVGAEGGTAPAVEPDAFADTRNEPNCTLYYPKGATGYGKDEISFFLSNWTRSEYEGLEIGSQPESRAVFAGQDASFSVSGVAGSPEEFGYRWQAQGAAGAWEDLADGNGYSGTGTKTLSIAKAAPALDGARYRCVVSNDVQTVPSAAAALAVKGAPVASGLSPASGTTLGGTKVTLTGSGFEGATSIEVGGKSVDFAVASDTEITFVTPAGDPGKADVVVRNPAGASEPLSFAYLAPAPAPAGGGSSLASTGDASAAAPLAGLALASGAAAAAAACGARRRRDR